MQSLSNGVITIGGLNAGTIRGLVGIVKGNCINASRNYGMPIATVDQLSEWATNQAELLSKSFLEEKTKADCAQIVCQIGGDTGNLKCFESKDGYLSCSELISCIQNKCLKNCIYLNSVAISLEFKRRTEKRNFTANDNVFWGESGVPIILCDARFFDYTMKWPNTDKNFATSIDKLFQNTLAKAWNINIDTLLENAKISDDSNRYDAEIGKIGEDTANYDFVDIFNKPE